MSAFANFAAKKFVKGKLGAHLAQEDIFYQEVVTKNGKKKKIKKGRIAGLSEKDAKILKRVKRHAWAFDLALNLGCGRFGLNTVIGLIPWIGDAVNTLLNFWVVQIAQEADLPPKLVAQMYANVAFDFGIQLVPLLGDIAQSVYKCNVRNTAILEKHLRQRAEETLRAQGAAGGQTPVVQEESAIKRWFHNKPGEHQATQVKAGEPSPTAPQPSSHFQASPQETGVYSAGAGAMQ